MARTRRSSLTAKTNAHRNTKAGRKAMAAGQFALPGRRYRIDDAAHARDALARVAQRGSPQHKQQVRRAAKRRFPSIRVTGITTRR